MPSDLFERFAVELVRRELYPGLNPTSVSYDFGEDARTEPSTAFMHGGKWISVSVSKTTSFAKIRADCVTRRDNGRPVDVVVYVTLQDQRTDIEEQWREEIRREFGWELELRTMRWLAPVASQPEYESLIDDYIRIPPPDGDNTQAIERGFRSCTERALSTIRDTISGLPLSLSRPETATAERQLTTHRGILLTGAAGTGKSAIGAALARTALVSGKIVLLLDARTTAHINTDIGLRQQLGLRGPIHSAVLRAASWRGCRLIIDQLDNVVGLPSAGLLLDLAVDAYQRGGAAEVVVISRSHEAHERTLLEKILRVGFLSVPCPPLGEETARTVLEQLGVRGYSDEGLQLARNLLNLELIARIRVEQPAYDFRALTDEVYLWERYLNVLNSVEGVTLGEEVTAHAARLAREALANADGSFELPYPLPRALKRMISWEIVIPIESRLHRFRHERFQEFIYAWDATQKLAMPKDVLREILPYRSPNVLRWMDSIYERQGSRVRRRFLKEAFDV